MNTHRFSVGKISLMVIKDGFENVGEDVISGMVKPLPEGFLQAFRALPQPYPFCYNALYLESGGEQILIDTGLGVAGSPDAGHLLDLLEPEGILPEKIDKVILSHLHLDHVGGLTVDGRPIFPKADIFLPKVDWEYWIESGKAPTERTQILKTIFQPYADRIQYIHDGDPVVEGVTVVELLGHTAGHCGFMIESQGEGLLHMVDVLHAQMQVAFPEASAAFDFDQEVSRTTRRAVLQRIADEGLLALSYHLPLFGLGRVERDGNSFTWKPVL